MVGSVLSGIKIASAVTAGVNNSSNQCSVGFYNITSISDTNTTSATLTVPITASPVIRVAGPGQNLPGTFTSNYQITYTGGAPTYVEGSFTYSLQSGFVLTNTP